jgi:hypothetical protein
MYHRVLVQLVLVVLGCSGALYHHSFWQNIPER